MKLLLSRLRQRMGKEGIFPFQSTPDKIRKRSLRRALKRAINFGKATYMGHPLRVWSHPQQATIDANGLQNRITTWTGKDSVHPLE